MVCRDRAALARANRKMDKRLKELQIQAEDERRSADQYKEQVSELCMLIRLLQVDGHEVVETLHSRRGSCRSTAC